MYYFIEKIRGDENADTIDVYEALDMALPGMFAYRSILAGGKKMEIPNLRNKEEREKWRNDTTCTFPHIAGDMLVPAFSLGTPEIPDEVYARLKKKHDDEFGVDVGYLSAALTQSSQYSQNTKESNNIMMRDDSE